ncbi:MAG TPA: hypothetical protein DDW27_14370 [Bacteroidales bacterium]|nr:hypothetical protein [Bacteroidales bacterium]
MSTYTRFDSRTAKVNYSPEVVYNFATDIRNFRRFIPSGSFSDIDFRQDSCSFRADYLGTVSVQLSERVIYKKIVFSGNAMMQNDFSITLFLHETPERHSEIKLIFEAEMNPFLKMAASEPLRKFLDTMMDEIENFSGWADINEYNQPL